MNILEFAQHRKELPVEQLWRQGFGKVAKRGVYIQEAVRFLIESGWYRTLPLCNLARLKESWERIAENRVAWDNPLPPSQLEELCLAAIVDAAEPKLSVRSIADMVGYGMGDMDGEAGRKHVLKKMQLFFEQATKFWCICLRVVAILALTLMGCCFIHPHRTYWITYATNRTPN